MIKALRTSALSVLMITLLMLVPFRVHAEETLSKPNIQQGLCSGIYKLNVSVSECNNKVNEDAAQKQVNDLIRTVINLLSSVVGIIAVIMVMVGGFKYITSGGNDSNVSGAKNTILYAIIGIVVVAFAQYLVKYVLAQVVTK
jgi:hypothetical protein